MWVFVTAAVYVNARHLRQTSINEIIDNRLQNWIDGGAESNIAPGGQNAMRFLRVRTKRNTEKDDTAATTTEKVGNVKDHPSTKSNLLERRFMIVFPCRAGYTKNITGECVAAFPE